ncbi:UbiX family flavin prenyltransferase [Hydrogenivirga sp. 128-5-R1-1]|uniref:UbiX family flavin prenyltransferase n=1 Tax=Hydrogenivirga sp. 128-5-R1-1 TaxID=392423 RepID=UPI00015F0DA2|nr:UbiX family flavin prenyltransferase [Hydrogenivirga sp. 128-5-R1-1]EDP74298.1 phenylacrylic acid decarboxylase [Hydrogenivirga sp. 128-5-R1-1]
MKKYVLCITGASGVKYGLKLLEQLSKENFVYLLISNNGYLVLEREEGISKKDIKNIINQNVKLINVNDMSASIASGSRIIETEGVIIAPCSMSTLGAVANGVNYNLIHRVADIALKEKVKLYLLIREMPLSLIHVKNMEKLMQAGAVVSSASPGFYHNPKTVDDMVNFVVGKVLDSFRIQHNLYKKWREDED